MSVFQGIVKGAMRQGLSSINETNEFYNDLVRTASAHIGNATQQANNSFPEDVKGAEKKYTNYIALVETIGKDKADYIFENTSYLDNENWRELSTNAALGLGTEDGSPFKYYARVEPIEAIAKLANANINNVKNQIKNSSSLRGMSKVSDLYLPMLPQEATFDASALPPSDGGSMTEAERANVSKFVVLPTEITSIENQNLVYSKLIDKAGGDINKAATMFNVKPEILANAKSAITEFSSTDRAALSLVNTDKYVYALQYGTPETQALELVKLQQQIGTMKTVVEAIQGTNVSVDDQTANIINAVTDSTMFNIGGKERSFADIMKVYRRDNKDVTKEQVIRDLLDSNNFSPITS